MELAIINQKIYTVRSVKIMLDRDLAELYEVETRVLNQSVKRNKELFPSDFMFQLTKEEYENMSDIKNKTPKFCIAVCIYRAWSCHVVKCLKKYKSQIDKCRNRKGIYCIKEIYTFESGINY